jgi:hypothetical protein
MDLASVRCPSGPLNSGSATVYCHRFSFIVAGMLADGKAYTLRPMTLSALSIPRISAEDLHRRRWMMFVDGENLTARAQAVATAENVTLIEGENYKRDVFVWIPDRPPVFSLTNAPDLLPVQRHGIRAYYYTSMVGSDDQVWDTKDLVRGAGFYPEVFKRQKGSRDSKGVDIALTIDILRGAYMSLFDVAVLVTGDGDYVPVVREVQRLGKVVCLIFFEHSAAGLNQDLRLASDRFFDMTKDFCDKWRVLSASAVRPPK